jgi:hypothetical protein
MRRAERCLGVRGVFAIPGRMIGNYLVSRYEHSDASPVTSTAESLRRRVSETVVSINPHLIVVRPPYPDDGP